MAAMLEEQNNWPLRTHSISGMATDLDGIK